MLSVSRVSTTGLWNFSRLIHLGFSVTDLHGAIPYPCGVNTIMELTQFANIPVVRRADTECAAQRTVCQQCV